MPRKQRVWVPGDTYHITCRGNHQQSLFRDDEDREFYLVVLKRLKAAQSLPVGRNCVGCALLSSRSTCGLK